jgi:preprotein translocase subunit SecA
MTDFLRRWFDSNERDIARYRVTVEKINALEPVYEKMSDAQLRAKTDEFRKIAQKGWLEKLAGLVRDTTRTGPHRDEALRLAEEALAALTPDNRFPPEEKEQARAAIDRALYVLERHSIVESERKDKVRKALDDVLDELLPDVFALVREAAKRTLGQRHYDVQLIGGMVAHDGRIAELKTGEGKTLMATLPLYLNGLVGRGSHLVTANDYLSKVGAVWMGPIYDLLGMSVGIIQGQSPETGDEGGSYLYDPAYEDPDPRFTYCRRITRREAYECDVTYGTNNEFGFDYLRDNMARHQDETVQRDLHFAIVDEVDSILIDEARTPLIISGMVERDTRMYFTVDKVIRQLRAGKEPKNQQERDDPSSDRNNPNIDYLIDEKQKTVSPTDAGIQRMERMLGIQNLSEDPEMMHYVTAAMKAHAHFKKDIDYVIKDGELVIVDEFTGRLMFGRRWSDGLHEAIEAKEGIAIKHESQTMATITFQNLFRLYLKLAGMTGTAKTEEDEFRKIYGLDVVVVPTNKPMIRVDRPDKIYKNVEHKFRGIAAEILRLYARQQPVLVGTRSIEMSEKVSGRITPDRLQVLALTALIRDSLEKTKGIDKARREQWTSYINSDLDGLSLNRLTAIAKELGINPDPLAEENLRAIAQMLGVGEDDETLDNLDEALRHGIPHNILNAKYHEKEAIIIAEAGRKGAVTVATNMAGRGVDIILGGKPEEQELPAGTEGTPVSPAPESDGKDGGAGGDGVNLSEFEYLRGPEQTGEKGEEGEKPPEEPALSFRRGGRKHSVLDTVTTLTPEEHRKAAGEVCERGGLFILGTERHESRRIDNQLRGRSGRQGDPGESRFYVSLEDELWRLFGDRSNHPLLRTWPEDQAIDARILSRMIERAQKKVEEHHFESRKHVLQYDDVMNKQREVIYRERRRILEGEDLRETIVEFLRQTIADSIVLFCPETEPADNWDMAELYEGLDQFFGLSNYARPQDLQGRSRADLQQYLTELIENAYDEREREIVEESGYPEAMRDLERQVALYVINGKWMEHLANIDYLREGIFLRGYAQQDPLVVYQKEAFEMFENMMHSIQDEIARYMFQAQVARQPRRPRREYNTWTNAEEGGAEGQPTAPASRQPARSTTKRGRNDPCPCGSGRKYKHCCWEKDRANRV